MICPACGQEIPESSSYCLHCGAPVLATRSRHRCPMSRIPRRQRMALLGVAGIAVLAAGMGTACAMRRHCQNKATGQRKRESLKNVQENLANSLSRIEIPQLESLPISDVSTVSAIIPEGLALLNMPDTPGLSDLSGMPGTLPSLVELHALAHELEAAARSRATAAARGTAKRALRSSFDRKVRRVRRLRDALFVLAQAVREDD